jgi:hypothetical protein
LAKRGNTVADIIEKNMMEEVPMKDLALPLKCCSRCFSCITRCFDMLTE